MLALQLGPDHHASKLLRVLEAYQTEKVYQGGFQH